MGEKRKNGISSDFRCKISIFNIAFKINSLVILGHLRTDLVTIFFTPPRKSGKMVPSSKIVFQPNLWVSNRAAPAGFWVGCIFEEKLFGRHLDVLGFPGVPRSSKTGFLAFWGFWRLGGRCNGQVHIPTFCGGPLLTPYSARSRVSSS